jgi:hypothetical protein
MEDLSKQKAQALEIAGGLAQGAQERQMARADANRAADRNAMLKIAQARQQPWHTTPARIWHQRRTNARWRTRRTTC